MKILFDQGTPAPLRRYLIGHTVHTAAEFGWSNLSNGDLLAAAEEVVDVLITTDQNLRYQQDVRGRRIAILVLMTTAWPRLQPKAAEIAAAVNAIVPGSYTEYAP